MIKAAAITYLAVAAFAFLFCAVAFGVWIFWPAGSGRDIWDMVGGEKPEGIAARAVIKIIVFGILIFLSFIFCATWPVIALIAVIAAAINKMTE